MWDFIVVHKVKKMKLCKWQENDLKGVNTGKAALVFKSLFLIFVYEDNACIVIWINV